MLRRRWVVLVVLGAGALTVAACQSGEGDGGAEADTTAVVETDRQATTTTQTKEDPAAITGAASIWNVPNKTPEDVAEFWTPERMQSATPVEKDVPDTVSGSGKTSQEPSGPSFSAPGKDAPAAETNDSKSSAARIPSPPRAKAPFAYKRYAWAGSNKAMPARTHGKVFFSKHGEDWVCSGTSVNSANLSVVWTAGHCAVELREWALNWVFVPGYRDGKAPYGRWKARAVNGMYSINGWIDDQNWRYDIAAVIIDRRADGKRLGDIVGYQGITFGKPADKKYWSFGYPEGEPFNGEFLFTCEGRLGARPAPTDRNEIADGPPMVAIGCDMTGGSSGGSWLIGFNKNRGWGWVDSVNSNGPRTVMWGPYHGEAALNLWRTVQGL